MSAVSEIQTLQGRVGAVSSQLIKESLHSQALMCSKGQEVGCSVLCATSEGLPRHLEPTIAPPDLCFPVVTLCGAEFLFPEIFFDGFDFLSRALRYKLHS